MSYTKRRSKSLNSDSASIFILGWLGDSICEGSYMGSESDRLRFSAIVSSYYGAVEINNGLSGRTLSSFLPYLTGEPSSTTAEFNGQWLKNGEQWYWNRDGNWVSVPNTGTATDRVGTNPEYLSDLFTQSHVIIAQSGVNDNAANLSIPGATDYDANGSYHYNLLLSEIVRRLHNNSVQVILVTGTTASNAEFHGTSENYSQELIGRYSEAARQVAFEKGLHCCDVGLRLNLELANGRMDILTRVANSKPDNQTSAEWSAYLASKGDPTGTNVYRVFDESEDHLHVDDASRYPFWYNLHPGPFGHFVISNEIIKFINEFGLTELSR